MEDVHEGSCLCGAVRFHAEGTLRGVVYCHCTQCRKQSGHFYAATNVANDRLQVDGADAITWFRASASASRGFCRQCGSALFWKLDAAEQTSVMAGAFDKPTGLRGETHIFLADKGDYYEVSDSLPKHDRSSPAIAVAPAGQDRND